MHFPCSGRIVLTAPVIQTESHIGRLLHFSHKYSSFSRVNGSGLDENGIPGLRMNHIQQFVGCTGFAGIVKFLSRGRLAESHINFGIRLSIKNIPNLSLAEGVVSLGCNFIVGMNLHRKLLMNIQEFYQKGELSSEPGICGITADSVQKGFHYFTYGVAGKPPFADHRVLFPHIGKFPALAYEVFRSEFDFVPVFVIFHKRLPEGRDEYVSTPDPAGSYRNELKRI